MGSLGLCRITGACTLRTRRRMHFISRYTGSSIWHGAWKKRKKDAFSRIFMYVSSVPNTKASDSGSLFRHYRIHVERLYFFLLASFIRSNSRYKLCCFEQGRNGEHKKWKKKKKRWAHSKAALPVSPTRAIRVSRPEQLCIFFSFLLHFWLKPYRKEICC